MIAVVVASATRGTELVVASAVVESMSPGIVAAVAMAAEEVAVVAETAAESATPGIVVAVAMAAAVAAVTVAAASATPGTAVPA